MNGDLESRPIRMLFALLKLSLSGGEIPCELFEGATETAWKSCYKHAVVQGVMALAWDGVMQLPVSSQPPRVLKLAWAMAVERYEERYAHYCRTVHELTELLQQQGIGLMQLKGVGFSTYYPKPSHREGGDIDVWFYSLDPLVMSDGEAQERAEQLMEERGIVVERNHSEKHHEFCFNGILIESHRTFLNVYNTPEAKPMDDYLFAHCEPVQVSLLEGECPIWIPSEEFNVVFIGFHAAQHYVHGLALHHLCDWACIVRKGGLSLLPAEVFPPKVMRFIDVLTALVYRHLGVGEGAECDEIYARKVLDEMIDPQYSPAKAAAIQGNPWQTFVFKTKRFFYRHRKLNSVFTISMTGRLREVYKNNVRNPLRLFKMTGK